jgi:hypothetical protein
VGFFLSLSLFAAEVFAAVINPFAPFPDMFHCKREKELRLFVMEWRWWWLVGFGERKRKGRLKLKKGKKGFIYFRRGFVIVTVCYLSACNVSLFLWPSYFFKLHFLPFYLFISYIIYCFNIWFNFYFIFTENIYLQYIKNNYY